MTIGRPPKYKTPEELQKKIDEYFEKGVNTKQVVVGKGDNKQVLEMPVPTITGLALYLGFCSRQSFYDYGGRKKGEGFAYTIKRARTFIERDYEEQLKSGNVAGAIFALKNMGWKDKTEQDITSKGERINFSVNFVGSDER